MMEKERLDSKSLNLFGLFRHVSVCCPKRSSLMSLMSMKLSEVDLATKRASKWDHIFISLRSDNIYLVRGDENAFEWNDDMMVPRLPVNRLHVVRKVEGFRAWRMSSVDLIHHHSLLHHGLGSYVWSQFSEWHEIMRRLVEIRKYFMHGRYDR